MPEQPQRPTHLPVWKVMEDWKVGSFDWSWRDEYAQLWGEPNDRMSLLAASIKREGVREAVLLGDDGRVWDGHHRLCAAYKIDSALMVPVEYGTTYDGPDRTHDDAG